MRVEKTICNATERILDSTCGISLVLVLDRCSGRWLQTIAPAKAQIEAVSCQQLLLEI